MDECPLGYFKSSGDCIKNCSTGQHLFNNSGTF